MKTNINFKDVVAPKPLTPEPEVVDHAAFDELARNAADPSATRADFFIDLYAHAEIPPTRFVEEDTRPWLAGSFFRLGCVTMMYGPPGSMKSMVAQSIALHMVFGEDMLREPNMRRGLIKIVKTRALYMDFDQGPEETRVRFWALAKGMDKTEIQLAQLEKEGRLVVVSDAPPPDFTKTSEVEAFCSYVTAKKAHIIFIDCLGKIIPEKVDLNSAKAGDVMTGLRHVASKTGAAIVLLHHTPKATGKSNGEPGATSYGSQMIPAGLDNSVEIVRLEEGGVRSRKIGLYSAKERGAEADPSVALEFEFEHKPDHPEVLEICDDGSVVYGDWTERSRQLDWASFKSANIGQIKIITADDYIFELASTVVSKTPMNRQDLATELLRLWDESVGPKKPSKSSVLSALTHLVNGWPVKGGGGLPPRLGKLATGRGNEHLIVPLLTASE